MIIIVIIIIVINSIMQLISKFNKGFRFLLCVIDIFSKYTWVVPLKYKKGISIINAFKKVLDKSERKPNKIWVDKGSEFYKNSFNKFYFILFFFSSDILRYLFFPYFLNFFLLQIYICIYLLPVFLIPLHHFHNNPLLYLV